MYLKNNTDEGDYIYTFSGPGIYINSERSSASRHLVLMMGHAGLDYVPDQLTSDLSNRKPVYVVLHDSIPHSFNSTLEFVYNNYSYEHTIGEKQIYRINSES